MPGKIPHKKRDPDGFSPTGIQSCRVNRDRTKTKDATGLTGNYLRFFSLTSPEKEEDIHG
jgi:hypothetical protein